MTGFKQNSAAQKPPTDRKALSPDETDHSDESMLSDKNIHYDIGKTRFEVTPVYKDCGARTVTGILIKMLREDESKRTQRL